MKSTILILYVLLLSFNSEISSQIIESWKSYYNSPNDSEDASLGIIKDSQGNTYVTGYTDVLQMTRDILTIKFSPTGAVVWTDIYDAANSYDIGNRISIDNSGNIIVTGSTGGFAASKILTIKYSSGGSRLWVKKFDNPNSVSVDAGTGILFDASNNIYICGPYTPANNLSSQILIKYNSSGNLIWSKTFSGSVPTPAGFGTTPIISFDNANNIVMAGKVYNNTNNISNTDILVNKISPAGNIIWSAAFNNPLNSDDDVSGIDITHNNTIYLTGSRVRRVNNNNNLDILTLKLTSGGNVAWSRFYNYSNDPVEYSMGNSVKTDDMGNIYVAGYTGDNIINGPGSALLKYSSSGQLQWVRAFDQPASRSHEAFDLAIDDCNYLYLFGTEIGYGQDNSYSYQVIKCNTNGTLLWEKSSFINDLPNNNGGQHGISASWRNKYDFGITGSTINTPGELDVAAVSYTQNFFTVSGQVTYSDNNQPVPAGGHVKAFYYDNTTASIVVVDSATIQNQGLYTLSVVPKDSLYLMYYQDDDLLQFVPTYFYSTIDWRMADRIFVGQNLTNINCQVERITNTPNAYTISGQAMAFSGEGVTIPLKDAVIYAKIGNEYKNYGITDEEGAYTVTKLPPGAYTLVAHRMGFSPVSRNVTITDNGVDNVNFNFGSPIGIQTISQEIPESFSLSQNYPNPFNPVTTIRFGIPKAGMTSVKIFDILGRLVTTVVDENLNPGSYSVKWDASGYTSGIYFYRIESESFTETKKMILIK